MTDRAAHLVGHVFPAVPIRQWILTMPPRLRYLLAWDYALCRAATPRLTPRPTEHGTQIGPRPTL